MYSELLCLFLAINVIHSNDEGLVYLKELQELCPYTSFCGENALMEMPANQSTTQCCKSCSCDPGCELYGSCCFESVGSEWEKQSVKCLSPIVGEKKVLYRNYVMIDSCSLKNSTSMCEFDVKNSTSYSPVVSKSTGDIYVNTACALCNGVSDIILWKLAIQCTRTDEYVLFYSSGRFYDTLDSSTGCYQIYLPPEQINLDSRACASHVIRQCNVTGDALKWAPFWEYCPLFNATLSLNLNMSFGNIFCLMCNTHFTTEDKECFDIDVEKNGIFFPFTVFLDNKEDFSLLEKPWEPDNLEDCGEGYVMLNSECRKIICPSGQFRADGKCGYHSTQWIGGPFTAVFKLTPTNIKAITIIDVTGKADPNDMKATWLKRAAMKNWNMEVLYRTDDCNYVEYFVVLATYPYEVVNPSRLRNKLSQTLNEVWYFNGVKLKVELNRYQHYLYHMSYTNCSASNITYGYTSDAVGHHTDNPRDHFLETAVTHSRHLIRDRMFLNHLFLCEQIQLLDEEFYRGTKRIVLKKTNVTLYETAYMITESASVRICLSNLLLYYNKAFRLTFVHWLPFLLFYWLFLV